MIFLFNAQIESHSRETTAWEGPCDNMNCERASTVKPRLRMPWQKTIALSQFCLMGRGEGRNEQTSHSGETGVVPSTDESLLDEPVEFALGQEGVDEVETAACRADVCLFSTGKEM